MCQSVKPYVVLLHQYMGHLAHFACVVRLSMCVEPYGTALESTSPGSIMQASACVPAHVWGNRKIYIQVLFTLGFSLEFHTTGIFCPPTHVSHTPMYIFRTRPVIHIYRRRVSESRRVALEDVVSTELFKNMPFGMGTLCFRTYRSRPEKMLGGVPHERLLHSMHYTNYVQISIRTITVRCWVVPHI